MQKKCNISDFFFKQYKSEACFDIDTTINYGGMQQNAGIEIFLCLKYIWNIISRE